jgi:hypothetical protein
MVLDLRGRISLDAHLVVLRAEAENVTHFAGRPYPNSDRRSELSEDWHLAASFWLLPHRVRLLRLERAAALPSVRLVDMAHYDSSPQLIPLRSQLKESRRPPYGRYSSVPQSGRLLK